VSGADPSTDRSYRALLSVPWLSRILLAMIVARIAQSMVAIAIVLFTLGQFGSPTLAGVVTLALTLPGLLVSPIAGALLDRHGRMRLVQLDYVVALVALSLIAILSLAGVLEPWLLILIATVSSLTAILSQTGLRSLFPVIVPEHLGSGSMRSTRTATSSRRSSDRRSRPGWSRSSAVRPRCW